MIGRIISLFIMTLLVGACSGSIYRQRPVSGVEPVAITVDARQRVLLSQGDRLKDGRNDPLFRRYCAEPSPDVFTVLGVSGSGGGNFGLGADKSVNAALQAAFSSSETGATIARTQTINMLREMMFRTCERYLSGAISPSEFSIIAARDQRIMVSTLAIEQLTGSITPRALALTSAGNATTGSNPTEMLKYLSDAKAAVDAADGEAKAKAKKQTEADAPPGTCATLKQKKAAGTPALAADETNKVKACEDADAAYAPAKDKLDKAQAHYDALLAASKSGLGTSSAASSGAVHFASDVQRGESVGKVAEAVRLIVEGTFKQDETQLFCIRALYGGENSRDQKETQLAVQCREYLLTKVQADEKAQADRIGVSVSDLRAARESGRMLWEARSDAVPRMVSCAASPEGAAAMTRALSANSQVAGHAQGLVEAAKRGEAALRNFLFDRSAQTESLIVGTLDSICP